MVLVLGGKAVFGYLGRDCSWMWIAYEVILLVGVRFYELLVACGCLKTAFL